jgi:hypothetical protein
MAAASSMLGTHGIFQQNSTIITDILDKLLSHATAATQSAGSQVNELSNNNDLTLTGSDEDEITQWVDETQWDQHPWIDLNIDTCPVTRPSQREYKRILHKSLNHWSIYRKAVSGHVLDRCDANLHLT